MLAKLECELVFLGVLRTLHGDLGNIFMKFLNFLSLIF